MSDDLKIVNGRKIQDFFTVDDKRYGWGFPSLLQQASAAARREALCGGFYGSMATSSLAEQRGAASMVMMITELELYVLQYPDKEPQGFSHMDDSTQLLKYYDALKESIRPFRDGGKPSAPSEE